MASKTHRVACQHLRTETATHDADSPLTARFYANPLIIGTVDVLAGQDDKVIAGRRFAQIDADKNLWP
jgi:hypothetical protein